MRRAAGVVVGLLLVLGFHVGIGLADGSGKSSKPPVDYDAIQGVEETQEGELEVLHEDGVNYSRYSYFLKQAGGKQIELQFVNDEPALKTGDRVRATGKRQRDDTLAVGAPATNITVLAAALPNTFGVQRTAVILVKFQDKPTAAHVTAAQAYSIMFQTSNPTSVTNFYGENSYRQTSLTGDVFGPFVIPLNSTPCDFMGIGTAAKAAAAAAGANLASYTRFVYAFPLNSCGWWGLGTVGGNPSQAWVNGIFENGVAAHELGHNFGLFHSHSLECGSVPIGGTCSSMEYGDSLDVMGSSTPPRHFNAVQKERLGWLNYGSSPPITTVLSSGVYQIEPYEPVGSNPKALKVRSPFGDWYYLEFRQATGFDAGISSNVSNGVVMHYTDGNANGIYLLDMTPATVTWSDPALVVGQSFTDAGAGITISPISVSAAGAAVNVTVGSSCVRRNPTVSVSPGSQQASAGATVSYTVAVSNNDDAGCGASGYSAQATAPSGWTRTFGASTLTISPGATLSTSLQVTSPAGVAAGSYTIAPAASNMAQPSYTGAASATYTVAVTCVRQNPLVTVSPASQQVPAGTPVTYTMSVTNKDSGCAASAFSTQATAPAGWTAGVATSSLTINAGGTAVTTVQVTSPATATSGNYTITLKATNSSQPAYTGSTTATSVVPASGGGGGGDPGPGTSGSFSDSFTRADAAELGNGWQLVSGALSVQSEHATNAATTGMHRAVRPELLGASQVTSMSFTATSTNSSPRFGLMARFQNDRNYYLCYRQAGGTSQLRISRVVNGAEKVLKTARISNPSRNLPFALGCEAQGNKITLTLNGAVKASVTDSTFSTGSVGFLVGHTSNGTPSAQIADDFSATIQ